MFPSIDELITDNLRWRLPAGLEQEIRQRYLEHGPEYLTDIVYNGRRVNACMEKDSWQDIREELVDAAFNVLVVLLKFRQGGGQEDMAAIDGVLSPINNAYVNVQLRQARAS